MRIIGSAIDVAGYTYIVTRRMATRGRYMAYRRKDDGSMLFSVIARRKINGEHRWSVLRQVKGEA